MGKLEQAFAKPGTKKKHFVNSETSGSRTFSNSELTKS